jgi:hypothetical protein
MNTKTSFAGYTSREHGALVHLCAQDKTGIFYSKCQDQQRQSKTIRFVVESICHWQTDNALDVFLAKNKAMRLDDICRNCYEVAQ